MTGYHRVCCCTPDTSFCESCETATYVDVSDIDVSLSIESFCESLVPPPEEGSGYTGSGTWVAPTTLRLFSVASTLCKWEGSSRWTSVCTLTGDCPHNDITCKNAEGQPTSHLVEARIRGRLSGPIGSAAPYGWSMTLSIDFRSTIAGGSPVLLTSPCSEAGLTRVAYAEFFKTTVAATCPPEGDWDITLFLGDPISCGPLIDDLLSLFEVDLCGLAPRVFFTADTVWGEPVVVALP